MASTAPSSSGRVASPYRQRQVAYVPPPSPIDVSNLVDRLRKPNAASAKKAAPWSTPRKQYDRDNFTFRTYFPNKERYKRKLEKFGRKQKHYHGNSEDDVRAVTKRVAQPTHSHITRSYDTILRRRDVEQIKWNEEQRKLDLAHSNSEKTPRDQEPPRRSKSVGLPDVHHHHHHGHNHGHGQNHNQKNPRHSASSSKTHKSSASAKR